MTGSLLTNDPEKARNNKFFKKIMDFMKYRLADEEEELIEDEDLF